MFSVTVCSEAVWFLLRRYCKWIKVNVAPLISSSKSEWMLHQHIEVMIVCVWILKCRKNNSEMLKHIVTDRSRTYSHCFHGKQPTISKSTSRKWFPQMKVGMIFFLFLLKKNFLFNYQEERGSVGIIGESFQKQVHNKLRIRLEYPDQFRKYYRPMLVGVHLSRLIFWIISKLIYRHSFTSASFLLHRRNFHVPISQYYY